jgi:Transposase DDE domain
MDATTLLITVYCLIDDWLAGRRLRQRGPNPILADSEVLTIECVGEFLGIDTDKGLYDYFRRSWGDWFPALGRIHRTTFTRKAANLWAVKAQLRQQLLAQVSYDPAVSILDSFPMPVCRFGRAYRCRRLAGLAAFGRDEGAKQTFYGVRAHLRVCWPGVICDGHLAPANLHDLAVADELLADAHGWALGDRSYWSPARAELLAAQDVWLVAPPRSARKIGAAPAPPADPGPPEDRDGDRPAGRALPRQTGLGPRRLAPMVTLATQAPQPHHRRLPMPADRPRPSPVRRPPHQLNPHTGLASVLRLKLDG